MATFQQELEDLIEQSRRESWMFVQLEAAVDALHHKHGRARPTPIIGTLVMTEPDDSFG